MEVLTRAVPPERPWTHLLHSTLRPRAAVLCLLLAALAARAQPPPSTEYEVKAAFLYNFAKFVEWPADAFADSRSHFVIGIVGSDPFGPGIDRALSNKVVHGRDLDVRRFPDAPPASGCHLLFFSQADSTTLRRNLQSVAGSTVLTVGEASTFLDLGGTIRFVLESNKVRFDIDVASAEAARLRISSKLLRLARVLRGVRP